MKVINLFGGPGTGKSTTAAGLFYLMKLSNEEVELVTEYAKYLVWADRQNMFEQQAYILAKQNHRLHILQDKVDWAVSDSPILLSCIYAENEPHTFKPYVQQLHRRYENLNFFLRRKKKYNTNGRNQTESEAEALDAQIKEMLDKDRIPYTEIEANAHAPWILYSKILHKVVPVSISVE